MYSELNQMTDTDDDESEYSEQENVLPNKAVELEIFYNQEKCKFI